MNAFQTSPNRVALKLELLLDVTRAFQLISTQGVS
jgi:hypothetical protein